MRTVALRLRASVFFGVVVFGALGAGCETDCAEVEPTYAGSATDEAWRVMLDAKASAEETDDVEVVTDLNVQAGASDFTVGWDSTLQVAALTPSLTPLSPRSPLRAHRERDVVDRVVDGVFSALLPPAHAHLPPVTSDIYLLEIAVPGRTCPVSALTTDEHANFSGDDLAAIVSEAGTRTLTLWSAFLTENRVTEGAYVTAPLTITVQ